MAPFCCHDVGQVCYLRHTASHPILSEILCVFGYLEDRVGLLFDAVTWR